MVLIRHHHVDNTTNFAKEVCNKPIAVATSSDLRTDVLDNLELRSMSWSHFHYSVNIKIEQAESQKESQKESRKERLVIETSGTHRKPSNVSPAGSGVSKRVCKSDTRVRANSSIVTCGSGQNEWW
jgi:hypothetical protein